MFLQIKYTGQTMLLLVIVVCLIGYHVYKSIKPPPPIPLPENVSEICPRIKLNDGRYLAYRELGFPKDKAKNKIIIIHGYGSSKLVDLKITQVFLILKNKLVITYSNKEIRML